MTVVVTFKYDPDLPEDHEVGMAEEEFDQLMTNVGEIGGYDVEVGVEPSSEHTVSHRPKKP